MKLNKLLMVLAASAFVACSSDDLSDFGTKQAPEDSRLVQLDQNFVLAGVGVEDAITRTHWAWEDPATKKKLVNKFLPIYNATAAAGNDLDDAAELLEQAVGLCWLGQGTVGTDVYTNYQFYHFGWLNNGETEADVECDKLVNGSLYSDITNLAAVTNGPGGEALPGTDWTIAELPAKSVKAGADNLNYNSGVYKTDNKAIFGGTYVVYYPFNENFKDAGTIPAKAETTFSPVSTSFDTPELGHATFRYSGPVTIEGGDRAADFGMYNLSSLVQLRVYAAAATDITAGDKIDQIVLYSPSVKLVKQANLAADKIVAGQKGEALYDSWEGTKTITANFAAADQTFALKAAAKSAYITVLPATVDDLEVLVHKTNGGNGTWAHIAKPTVFEAGKAKVIDVPVTAADFNSEFIAVDESSLIKARNEARLVATAANPVAIEVIGDITLDGTTTGTTEDPTADQYDFNNAADANITINGGDIIVPEDISLVVKFMTIESDIRVLGKSCCDGTRGGQLYIQGCTDGTTTNNIIMEPTKAKIPATDDGTLYDKYNPYVAFVGGTPSIIAAGKTVDVQAGRVVVAGVVEHKGDIQIAEGAKFTVNGTGDIQFMGSKVTNDGTIEVLKNGKFDITDKDGNASATDGKNMTNNGKFIHNVDAGVGTAVQLMKQNGEYRCKVNEQIKLDDALLQWTACSVIEMVNAAAYNYNLGTYGSDATLEIKHNNKYIDFEVNAGGVTTFNNPGTVQGDNKVINIGNLTVTKGGLDIDYVNGTAADKVGRRTLKVNGDMLVKATTNIVDSKEIYITENLIVEGAALTYKGGKTWGALSNQKLAVTKDIKVSGGQFNAAGPAATDVDALNISCANFTLSDGATATFANRTDGGAKNLVVSGAISNPAGCTFNIVAANQDGAGSVLAWVTCTQLNVGGTFSAARPRVVAP